MTTVKAKVTVRLDNDRPPSPVKANGVSSRPKVSSRPSSPSKSPSLSHVVRPKAKINSSANVNVRRPLQASPNAPRSAVSLRPPSPFKVNQRVVNKTVPGSATSSVSITRPPSVKPQPVGVQKSISSGPGVVTRMGGSTVLPNVTSRANTSSPELVTRQRRASITLHPPKHTVAGASRTAPSSPLFPGVASHVRNSSTFFNPRDLQPSPTPSIRVTSKVTKLVVNVKSTNTNEPAAPSPMTGPGHRPRVASVSNQRNIENLLSMSPISHDSPLSIPPNAKLPAVGRPRVPSTSQNGLRFGPPSTSVTPTPASTSSSPPPRSLSPLSRHRRVPSMAKSDIVNRFSPHWGNGSEDVAIQAPRPVRPNVGLPPANFSPKLSPFGALSVTNASGSPRPTLHLKTNSSPGTVSTKTFPVIAKVDPLSIPLPLNSPPASTVSYSSRSTVSSSSVTSTSPQHSALSGIGPTLNSHVGTGLGMGMTHRRRVSGVGTNENMSGVAPGVGDPNGVTNATGIKRRKSIQNGMQGGIQFLQRAAEEPGDSDAGSSLLDDLDLHEEDTDASSRRTRAEAKSMRKIEDLEITNRSLMAINATLEAAKHRQAKEIRELRRKLRESRLVLPPKAYRLVVSDASLGDLDDDDDDEDEETDEAGTLNMEKMNDEGFKRCRDLLDALLDNGRQALAAKPEDFEAASKSATKVLHAEELRSEADPDDRDRQDDDAEISIMTVSHDSEEEVEDLVSFRITTPVPPSS